MGCKYSGAGKRDVNEDACLLKYDRKLGLCAAVADGLGGHGGGREASQTAIDSIYESYLTGVIEKPEEFNVWFQSANQAVLNRQSRDCEMKTTLVVLLIRNEQALWAHIGDSRLYHFVEGRLVEQTFDHSVSQMAVLRGEIRQDQIRGHEDRNRLLRALGREETIQTETSQIVTLSGAEHAFLLCSDGFWEYVMENEMEKDLKASGTPEQWVKRMAERLDRRTLNRDNDNHTVVAVICGKK